MYQALVTAQLIKQKFFIKKAKISDFLITNHFAKLPWAIEENMANY